MTTSSLAKRRRGALAVLASGAVVAGLIIGPAQVGHTAPDEMTVTSATTRMSDRAPETSARDSHRTPRYEPTENPVRNLAFEGPFEKERKDGSVRYWAKLTWDAPLDPEDPTETDYVDEYVIRAKPDWRPQYWKEFRTGRNSVTVRNMRPGRTYEVVIQPDTTFGSDNYYEHIPAKAYIPIPGDSSAPWVISLGDSFISGEGGRWAGNTNSPRFANDVGDQSYWDVAGGELIPFCHRSASALIHIGVAKSYNLACSGAITATQMLPGHVIGDAELFKPGVDDNILPSGAGQTYNLRSFAQGKDIRMIALSIGGNDFKFSKIVTKCVTSYIFMVIEPCKDDDEVEEWLSDESQTRVVNNIAGSMKNIIRAMRDTNHSDSSWFLVSQLYPIPVATAANMRYDLNRQTRGGCGFKDEDLTWAIGTAVPLINNAVKRAAELVRRSLAWDTEFAGYRDLNIVHMDATDAFAGRELCNKNVKRLASHVGIPGVNPDWGGPNHWTEPGAVDRSEWVQEINALPAGSVEKDESFHPNYWGQLALRNCYRQLYESVESPQSAVGGWCDRSGNGLNAWGEPNMKFEPFPPPLPPNVG